MERHRQFSWQLRDLLEAGVFPIQETVGSFLSKAKISPIIRNNLETVRDRM